MRLGLIKDPKFYKRRWTGLFKIIKSHSLFFLKADKHVYVTIIDEMKGLRGWMKVTLFSVDLRNYWFKIQSVLHILHFKKWVKLLICVKCLTVLGAFIQVLLLLNY